MNSDTEKNILEEKFEPKNQYKYLKKQYEESSIDIYLSLLPNNLLFIILDWIADYGIKEVTKGKNKESRKRELKKLTIISEIITNELINRRLIKVKKRKNNIRLELIFY